MPRARKKQVTQPVTETTSETATAPDIFDEQIALRQEEQAQASHAIRAAEIVHGVAESTQLPEQQACTPPQTASGGPGTVRANGNASHAIIANPSSRRRESHVDAVQRRLPDKMTVVAGDLKVQLIDAGRNEMGIGIRVISNSDRKLTDEEKNITRAHIKGEEGQHSGFNWQPDSGLWLKHILREGEHVDDVPPSRPVAIRLDAERRVHSLAEALREHAADPVGYAAMVQHRREQAANAERIPD